MRGYCPSCTSKDAVLVEGKICYPCYEKYRDQEPTYVLDKAEYWDGVLSNG